MSRIGAAILAGCCSACMPLDPVTYAISPTSEFLSIIAVDGDERVFMCITESRSPGCNRKRIGVQFQKPVDSLFHFKMKWTSGLTVSVDYTSAKLIGVWPDKIPEGIQLEIKTSVAVEIVNGTKPVAN